MSDDQRGFKAFQSEWESESAYLFMPDGERKAAFLRVFNDQGGLIRIDLQVAENERSGSAEHFQLVVGQEELMRRLVEPQELPGDSPELPDSN